MNSDKCHQDKPLACYQSRWRLYILVLDKYHTYLLPLCKVSYHTSWILVDILSLKDNSAHPFCKIHPNREPYYKILSLISHIPIITYTYCLHCILSSHYLFRSRIHFSLIRSLVSHLPYINIYSIHNLFCLNKENCSHCNSSHISLCLSIVLVSLCYILKILHIDLFNNNL